MEAFDLTSIFLVFEFDGPDKESGQLNCCNNTEYFEADKSGLSEMLLCFIICLSSLFRPNYNLG
jgi:hypothetical protein